MKLNQNIDQNILLLQEKYSIIKQDIEALFLWCIKLIFFVSSGSLSLNNGM